MVGALAAVGPVFAVPAAGKAVVRGPAGRFALPLTEAPRVQVVARISSSVRGWVSRQWLPNGSRKAASMP